MQSFKYQDKTFALILFLLCPFVAMMRAFWCYRKPWAKNLVWLFTMFFGFTLVIAEGTDANRIRDDFMSMGELDTTFNNFLSSLYSEETNYADVVQPLICFLLSRFTNNHRILLAAFGLIFGYFYSRNIWYLLERAGPKILTYNLLLILTFTLLNAFWNINGFRFWTAAHVYLFGAVPYLIEGKKKWLWVMATSVFFHFSFMLPVAVLLAYIILGNRMHIFFCFFVISLFVYEIDFQIIKNLLSSVPGIFEKRASGYVSSEYAETISGTFAAQSWHARYWGKALRLVIVVLAVAVYIGRRRLMIQNKWLVRLFSFSLLFFGVFNILGRVPSVGRFLTVGSMCFIGFFFLYFQHSTDIRINKRVLILLMPAILFFCIVSIRSGCDFIGFHTLLGNPFTALFGQSETSIMDIIKR